MKKKNRNSISQFLMLLLFIVLANGCTKEEEEITLPVLTTSEITATTAATANCGGIITSDGGGTIAERGVCWSTNQSPTVGDSKTSDGSGSGSFNSSLTGLSSATTYYVRAYAINSAGTAYGNEISFNTLSVAPTLTSQAITDITSTTAISGGNISSTGGSNITARGVCWNTISGPTISNDKTVDGTGSGSFVSSLAGLVVATTYYVRAYATNSVGTSYGNEIIFITSADLPMLTTVSMSNITSSTATSGGNISSDGGGAITARGVCWNTSTNPTTSNNNTIDGTGTGSFISNLTGLSSSTTYYLRAYATNSAGTAYGDEVSFTTTQLTVTDADGNTYTTVTIGTQVWLVENLKTTKYNDGTAIPMVTDNSAWGTLSTPAYCWYNNDEATYKVPYGALYNYYVVATNKLCPTGWHVPTDDDWTTLIAFLGGTSIAGGKMKETGTIHWNSPNTGATNTSGFTGLPGGSRIYGLNLFDNIKAVGYWWGVGVNLKNLYLNYDDDNAGRNTFDNRSGLSIRCIKD